MTSPGGALPPFQGYCTRAGRVVQGLVPAGTLRVRNPPTGNGTGTPHQPRKDVLALLPSLTPAPSGLTILR